MFLTQFLPAQEMEDGNNIDLTSSEIRTGQLENGFRYFIKPIEGNEEKIHVDLIVRAGARQEDEDQYSIAHLLEHLSFMATENFPDLRYNPDFYSQLNMKPQDLRANIGGEKAHYSFRYSKEVPKALDTALSIYHDIASGKILFKEDAIEGEKKAIYQERIDGSDPGLTYPGIKIEFYLTGCNDAPHPNDMKAALMNSSTAALKRYYHDWYRPNLMGLVVIGNIDNVDQIEKKIKEKFEDLTVRGEVRPRKDCDQNYLDSPGKFIIQPSTSIVTKELVPKTSIQFYFRNPDIYFEDFSLKENDLLWELLSAMIDKRLKNEQLEYGVDYSTAIHPDGDLSAIRLVIKSKDSFEEVIRKVYSVLAGISKYGFENDEWEFIVGNKIEYLKKLDNNSIAAWAETLEKLILEDEALSTNSNFSQIEFLKNLKLEKINDLIRSSHWYPSDIAVIYPENIDKTLFTRPKIEQWIMEGLEDPVEYKPIIAPIQLMSLKEVSGLSEIKISDRRFGDYNEDVLILENGVKIILKDLKPEKGRYKDKIMLHGFSPYGAACLGSNEMETMLSPLIIQNSGAGDYNKFEVEKLLSKTSFPFGIIDYIHSEETGVKAEVSSQDMELLLQLIYLSFTSPRFDKDAFEDWKLEEERISRRSLSPNNDFLDFIARENDILKIPQGGERYRHSLQVNYKNAYNKYRELHANSRDFTFILTGDFQKNKIFPLIQKYLGNLPNTNNSIQCHASRHKDDIGKEVDIKTKHFQIPYKIENHLLSIQFKNELKSRDFREEVQIELLKQALNLKSKELRFKENLGIYFSVGTSNVDFGNNTVRFQIFLDSNKEDFDKALKGSMKRIDELKTELVSENFLQTVKNSAFLFKWGDRYKHTNLAMQRRLYDQYRHNLDRADLKEVEEYLKEFNVKDLQKTALKYLRNEDRLILIGNSEETLKL